MYKSASIIIPIYNTDKDKLKRCLGSCYYQNISKEYTYDIILAFDGGNDYLPNDFNYHNAKVLNLPRSYTFNARRAAVLASSNDVIIPVDSDDIVSPKLVSSILDGMNDKQCDVITYDLLGLPSFEIYGNTTKYTMNNVANFTYFSPGIAYSTELAKKVFKYPGRIKVAEDMLELLLLKMYSNKIAKLHTKLPLYAYFEYGGVNHSKISSIELSKYRVEIDKLLRLHNVPSKYIIEFMNSYDYRANTYKE